jgi:hypothetical protein
MKLLESTKPKVHPCGTTDFIIYEEGNVLEIRTEACLLIE